MAQYLTIARPYATGVFEEAKAEKSLMVAWANALQVLACVVKESAMKQKILDPRVSDETLQSLLLGFVEEVVNDAYKHLGVALENFVRLLIFHKRLQALPDILVLYKQLVAKHQKILNVEISSAFELSEQLQRELKESLTKRFKSELAVRYHVDPALIGGVVIRTRKFVVDASIRGKLNRLYHSLNG